MSAPPKVLIIDDEEGVRESLQFLMMSDFTVICAETMKKGIGIVKDCEPDTVILDLNLPDMSGIDGLREIRRINTWVPVIILTGYGSLTRAKEAIRLGANEFVSKPYDLKEMRAIIWENVNRCETSRRSQLSVKKLKNTNLQLSKELKEKNQMASLGQASAEYAHDICGPLTAVMGYVDFLSKQVKAANGSLGNHSDKILHILEAIEKNVNRCYELSKTWLTVAEKNQKSIGPIPVFELLEEIISEVFPEQSETVPQIIFQTNESPEDKCIVFGDQLQLFRAVRNIIVNAKQALPENKGVIGISFSRKNEYVEVRIADDGCGISKKQLKHVFDPYFTTKSAAKNKGTGLGLYITRRIIEEHNGTITIDSQPKKGTVVSIRLPIFVDKNI